MKHTQGEWKIRGTNSTVYIETEETIICNIEKFVNKNSINDAKLLVVAPELLEACQLILNNMEANKKHGEVLTTWEINSAINILKKAIKKATE